MPRWNIDNLMTHVAAAALIVDDFEVDVNDLREDLKIENKECVACPVYMATLTVQGAAVLPRAGLQGGPPDRGRPDQVQAHQGREQQPPHCEAAAATDVPADERAREEEEIELTTWMTESADRDVRYIMT
jgi:hypothetical protein